MNRSTEKYESPNKLVKNFEWRANDRLIEVDKEIEPGIKYFLKCEEGLNAYYIDINHPEDISLFKASDNDDYMAFMYVLSDKTTKIISDGKDYELSVWGYNLVILDATVKMEHCIPQNTSLKLMFVFMSKLKIKEELLKKGYNEQEINATISSERQRLIRFSRMKDDSFYKLKQLSKKNLSDPNFKFHFIATVNFLMFNCLEVIMLPKFPSEDVNENDLFKIISIQKYLYGNLDEPFPSIKILAEEAHMSETKFKTLFKKIVGISPSNYHLTNKLLKAKDLLDGGNLSINEVTEQLKFSNHSYFSHKFKKHFGITPTEYLKNI
ncbi:helix-turn-helix domain-containing protein [Galbibacter mesophilus]|nr:AraC family transcriptional regulator [Galbibacter mesophilus]MCM5663857.1 AraC family transcriptional regulator [Galbibacter mesophilus]